MDPDLLNEQSPTLSSIEGCEIEWKSGKNLTVREVTKKQKSKSGKKKGEIRTVTTSVPKRSFFQYFSEPRADEEEEEDEEGDDGNAEPPVKFSVEDDYEIGHALRTSIIPNAVLWYTGEAVEDDDEDEEAEDIDEDEEEEEGSEDDEGDDKKGMKAPAVDQTGAQAQPECKQS